MALLRLTLLLFLCWDASAATHPNVILIVADDLGWNDVGYHGSEIRTPRIDKLASEGVVLERYYTYPMCNPTRMALLTGRAPLKILSGAADPPRHLPLDETTMPQVFSQAGYQTLMVGKWHLGHERVDYFAHQRGFDHFYGFVNAGVDYYSHIASGGLDWQRNGKSVREEGYSTELFASEAVSLIKQRDRARPTLLYVAFNAVHAPLQAPESYVDSYAAIQNPDRRIYAGMTSAMDAALGRILDTLAAEGMVENSIIVFLSDNGGGLAADNSPLRGRKTQTLEGGIRVPAVIYRPGSIEGGARTNQYVTVHDWLPTLAVGAGIPLETSKPVEGTNLWAALSDNEITPNQDFVLGHRGNYAVFDGEWKLVHSNVGRDPQRQTMLYRVDEDPNEENDLAGDHPDVVARLTTRITELAGEDALTAPAARRPGAVKPRGGQRGQRGQGGRRGRRDQTDRERFPTATEETREPWAESAAGQ